MTHPVDEGSEASAPAMTQPGIGPSGGGRPSRLNQALAWVGIVAGGLFIVAAIFFSGFFLSWTMGGPHMGPGKMACCGDMKSGAMMPPEERIKPGAMMPPTPRP